MRVFILGIDSATFDIILPLVEAGEMPAMGKLMQEGAWGKLCSTHPPTPPSAWTSFMTGRKPENHGIFDFLANEMKGPRYKRRFVNSGDIRCHTLWQVLDLHNKKSVVIGMPMTYPPFPVNGALISGFITHGEHSSFTHPKELKTELLIRFGDYVLDPPLHGFGEFIEEAYIKSRFLSDQSKVHAADYLAERHRDWDLMAVIFSLADHVQHYFWKYIDPLHPEYDSERSDAFRRTIDHFYIRYDRYLQGFLERLNPADTVMIVSDHGAGPTRVVFNLDNWLEQNGFLNKNKRIMLKNGAKSIYRGGVDALRASLGRPLQKRKELLGRILYRKSRAFAGHHPEMGLYLNEKGKRPMGIVNPGSEYGALRNELIAALKEIREPKSGERVFSWVRPREEVHSGDLSQLAADILFKTEPGYTVYPSLAKNLFDYYPEICGGHTPEGIFIASGPAVKENCKLESAHIIDMAPTILYLMGLPIDGDMDGRVVEEIIRDDYLKNHPPESANYRARIGFERAGQPHTEDEEDILKEKLQDPGNM